MAQIDTTWHYDIPFISFDEGMWDYFEPELNSFLRAFTLWTGKSISAFRNDK